MKYSTWIGVTAALVLIFASFIPWTYYPDIDKTFTGFFSEGNIYGKPGKVLSFFSILAIPLFMIPRVWAKRLNMLVTALTIAYCVKAYILFTSCYRGICPEKRTGIFLILIASGVMIIAAILPDLKLKEKGIKNQ
jgi:hypothetical protein